MQPRDNAAQVFRPIRSLITLGCLGVLLWFCFSVPLGSRTFAEHMDAISETEPAQELLDGTREKINPALEEVRDRVLGEYVEAPTYLPDGGWSLPPQSESAEGGEAIKGEKTSLEAKPQASQEEKSREDVQAEQEKASTADNAGLPGQ